jgi:hypothetical protein
MGQIRLDIYGGYSDEKKPDPDHIYSWKQYSHETAQDFLERIQEYLKDIVEQLDEDNTDEND